MVQLLILLLTVFAAFFLILSFLLSLLHLFPLSFCLSPSRTALDYLTVLLCVTFFCAEREQKLNRISPPSPPLSFYYSRTLRLNSFFFVCVSYIDYRLACIDSGRSNRDGGIYTNKCTNVCVNLNFPRIDSEPMHGWRSSARAIGGLNHCFKMK